MRKTGRLLIVDEPPAPCGFGAEIAARVADAGFDDLDAPIRRLNGRVLAHAVQPAARSGRRSATGGDCRGDSRPDPGIDLLREVHSLHERVTTMAHEIRIPRLGWSMEEGTFVGWLKQPGDEVAVGEPLFELEGEKAVQEIELARRGHSVLAA